MSENIIQDLMGGDGRSFEERVMARFDAMGTRFTAIDSSLLDVNARLEKLEARAYDSKPIWEHALREIAEMRREFSKRFDHLEAVVLENRADIRDAEDCIEKIEQKLKP